MGKRIEAKEMRCSKRRPLEELIPLPAPFVVYIEPANVCNFKCIFCPTGDPDLLKKVGRPAGVMSMDLFKRIVDGLAEFPQQLNLANLYKDGEPLVNPHFPEMVAYLKQSGIAKRLWTKTNGALLNPELNRRLIESGLDWIGISVEALDSEGYFKIAGVKLDYDRFRENIADLFRNRGKCEIYIKIANVGLSDSDKERFYRDFSDIADYCAVENLMGWSNSGLKDFTLGFESDTYDGLPFTEKDICAYPFYVMAFNFNGSVSLCGNDWSHATVVGDASKERVFDIWHGERMKAFRMMMLDGKRKSNPACGDCYYLKIVPDNLDPHRERIRMQLNGATPK